jgi:hypothetical protein
MPEIAFHEIIRIPYFTVYADNVPRTFPAYLNSICVKDWAIKATDIKGFDYDKDCFKMTVYFVDENDAMMFKLSL